MFAFGHRHILLMEPVPPRTAITLPSVDGIYLNYELGALRTLCKYVRNAHPEKSDQAVLEAIYAVHLATELKLPAKQTFFIRCACELAPWLTHEIPLEQAYELLDIAKVDRSVIDERDPNLKVLLFAIPSGREIIEMIQGRSTKQIRDIIGNAQKLARNLDLGELEDPMQSAVASATSVIQPI